MLRTLLTVCILTTVTLTCIAEAKSGGGTRFEVGPATAPADTGIGFHAGFGFLLSKSKPNSLEMLFSLAALPGEKLLMGGSTGDITSVTLQLVARPGMSRGTSNTFVDIGFGAGFGSKGKSDIGRGTGLSSGDSSGVGPSLSLGVGVGRSFYVSVKAVDTYILGGDNIVYMPLVIGGQF